MIVLFVSTTLKIFKKANASKCSNHGFRRQLAKLLPEDEALMHMKR